MKLLLDTQCFITSTRASQSRRFHNSILHQSEMAVCID